MKKLSWIDSDVPGPIRYVRYGSVTDVRQSIEWSAWCQERTQVRLPSRLLYRTRNCRRNQYASAVPAAAMSAT